MPRVIECPDEQACSVAECLEALRREGFEPNDEESLHHAAGWLRRLGNNRDFLAEVMIERLKTRHRAEDDESSYGPQVIMLSPADGHFFVRANIWPSRDEYMYRSSGADSFVYGLPHDHNFDFLTVGYFGPGYWSDYYEFDYEALDGWRGEPAHLRFVERARLEPGKLMLYRAHRDVHAQLPPDSLSVSLNVMHMTGAQSWYDQYRFDTETDEIGGILNQGASDIFLRIAVGMGGEEALDLAEHFCRSHPSDRMRLAAYEARATLLHGDCNASETLWREAELGGSRMVAMEARARRAMPG